jgi:SAM-dependent methyltransferase
MRKACVVCNSSSLEHLYTFKNFPVFMGASDGTNIRKDQVWGICQGCGCIQLKELVDLEVLYRQPHNPAIGTTWERHNIAYADFIKMFKLGNVLELGGGNCKIANLLVNSVKGKYVIYDKFISNKSSDRISCVNKFYDPKDTHDTYDVIVSSHVVEHLYDPLEYFNSFREILSDGGLVIFSFPDITAGIEAGNTNALNFEHTYQLDCGYLIDMMSANGFSLSYADFFNDYNPFFAFVKSFVGNPHPIRPVAENRAMFNKFIFDKMTEADLLEKQLSLTSGKKYLFGCHVFSQYLLHFLGDVHIDGIIDNDPNKIGKRLYGTSLEVFPSSVVKDQDSTVVVRAGVYNDEIITYLKSFNEECTIL